MEKWTENPSQTEKSAEQTVEKNRDAGELKEGK